MVDAFVLANNKQDLNMDGCLRYSVRERQTDRQTDTETQTDRQTETDRQREESLRSLCT